MLNVYYVDKHLGTHGNDYMCVFGDIEENDAVYRWFRNLLRKYIPKIGIVEKTPFWKDVWFYLSVSFTYKRIHLRVDYYNIKFEFDLNEDDLKELQDYADKNSDYKWWTRIALASLWAGFYAFPY